jgi:hypothetical protein
MAFRKALEHLSPLQHQHGLILSTHFWVTYESGCGGIDLKFEWQIGRWKWFWIYMELVNSCNTNVTLFVSFDDVSLVGSLRRLLINCDPPCDLDTIYP